MGDRLPVFKAATVQAASVLNDREASTDKACRLIAEAAQNGAELIVLPEVFIAGGPYWAWHMPHREGQRFSVEMYQNSVEIPSPTTQRLAEAAREAGAYVVIGVNERAGKTIYNTLLFFDRQGRIVNRHRKFKGTGAEKLVWGDGDGSTHKVVDTELGKMGGLICGEHAMVLPGYTLGAMGEQIHIAAWVGFASSDPSTTEICSRYHAIAYDTFVICSQSVVAPEFNARLGIDRLTAGNAWSAIIEAGSGRVIAGPLAPDEEGIVYAEVDLNRAIPHSFIFDSSGHYWAKQFRVLFDDRELNPLTRERGSEARVEEAAAQDGTQVPEPRPSSRGPAAD